MAKLRVTLDTENINTFYKVMDQFVDELIKSGKPLSTQLISSEASWLPKFIGEVDAMHEMMFGDEEGSDVMQVPQGQARIESILPQQTAMLNTMQQTLGG